VANSASGESVIRRVAKIMASFDDSHPRLTVSALARRSGLPQTTAYRMVEELVLEGLLQRDTAGMVQIGNRLWERVSRSSPTLGLREAAMPFMEDVQVVVGHHTALGVLDSDEVLYIERLGSRSSTISIARLATRLPLHGASSGLVLLAFADPAYQDQILSRRLERFTPSTVTDPGMLRRELAEVRRQGFAVRAGIIVPESSGIAVPVFDADGTVVAALSVIVPVGQENAAATVPLLRAAARGISRALGWSGGGDGTVRRSVAQP
jgi:DNA-binding IclR family transcriptional regulator